MAADLQTSIQKLSDRHLKVVFHELAEIMREGTTRRYGDDAATGSWLANLTEAQARDAVGAIDSAMQTGDRRLNSDDLRALLLFLGGQPEFEDTLRRALDRRMLVSVPFDPILTSALLVFILSIKWKFRVRKSATGRIEFEFAAGKAATPVSLLKSLISLLPDPGASPKPPGKSG